MNVFAIALRDAIKDREWSAGRLSREMGGSPTQQTVSRWLASVNLPHRAVVPLVADALGEDREKWRDLWNRSDTTEEVPIAQTRRKDLDVEVAWLRSAVEQILLHLDIPATGSQADGRAPRPRR